MKALTAFYRKDIGVNGFFVSIKEFAAFNREKIVAILAFFVGITESTAFNWKKSGGNGVFLSV